MFFFASSFNRQWLHKKEFVLVGQQTSCELSHLQCCFSHRNTFWKGRVAATTIQYEEESHNEHEEEHEQE